MNDPNEKKSNGFWTRFAAQALYIVAFAGLMGAVGIMATGLATEFAAGSLLTAGISAGAGLLAAVGNTYLTGKIEDAKVASDARATQQHPVVLMVAEPQMAPQKQFAAAIKAERAAQIGQNGRGV